MNFLKNLFNSVKSLVTESWNKVVDFFTDTEPVKENPVRKVVAWVISSVPVVIAAGMTFVWPFVFTPLVTGAAPILAFLLVGINALYWLIPAIKAASRAIDGDNIALAVQAFSWVSIIPLVLGISIILGGGSALAIPASIQLIGTIPLFIRAFWAFAS